MEQNNDNSKNVSKVKDNRGMTYLCGSLLLSVAFLYFFLSPLYQEKLEMDKVYATKQEDLKSKNELLKNIETFNEENKDLTVNSQKLVLLIPNRNNYEDFFIHLQQLSRNFNLELQSFALEEVKNPTVKTSAGTVTSTGVVITPEGTTTSPTVHTANQQGINISLRGDFASFLSFTKALENGVPFLQENKLSIASNKENAVQPEKEGQLSEQNPMLNFELNLRFIYY
ncbi:MAG: hypothetical protein PHX30_05010 [Candidatus Pacebacteria bacterium]|nr:hypothetical protein [Candidatus Paceibacterota bacterium]